MTTPAPAPSLSLTKATAIISAVAPAEGGVDGNNNNTSGGSDSNRRKSASEIKDEQLAEDLALFLSNPSLQAALADGSLDLASYSNTVEEELSILEEKCVNVYRSKATEIQQLQQELLDSNSILLGLQEMLLGFQADLGGLSGDIRQLQETSKRLGIQLSNRNQAEEGLRRFLHRVVLSPQLTHTICRGPVSGLFQESVAKLQQHYKDTHDTTAREWSCNVPPSSTVAGKEMQSHVAQLRWVAVSRIRDYFLQQLSLLRKPQTNVRMIQTHGLLQYNDLYDFVAEASPDIATELFQVYVDSMSKTLYALFRTYQAQLIQLDATRTSCTRQDVLAMEDSYLRDAITTKAKKRVDVFSVGTRTQIVMNDNQDDNTKPSSTSSKTNSVPGATALNISPILAHVAIAEHAKYPYERLFQSCLLHLVHAVTNEHVFVRQMFKRDAFGPLFTPTLSLLLEQFENYLFGCYDAICLLLMIKVVHQMKSHCNARTIHSLNPFWDQVTRLIWPRLNTVMQNHLRSITQANATKLGGIDLHAHYVSRRVAEFSCSLLCILQTTNNATKKSNQESQDKSGTTTPTKRNTSSSMTTPASKTGAHVGATPSGRGGNTMSAGDVLLQDLQQLLNEFVFLLERLSEEHSTPKQRCVFMINNLDMMIGIFQERKVAPGHPHVAKILEQLLHQRELFVEEELLQGFSKLIAFVQQTESHLASSASGGGSSAANPSTVVNIQVVEMLIREFASNWRSSMEQMNRNVLSYFSNFRNGMEILKQVLTQLLLYYTRFQEVLRKIYGKHTSKPACLQDLVPTTVLLAEIKKYALAI